ncbi:MAG TPA: glycosyltransferase 87 family protein [Microlunatus sp.]|nr:glycosyltransferase 87 family protein [Microlunatus sp.]
MPDWRPVRRVLTLGEVTLAAAASVAGYWELYRAQRDLFLNGVPPHNPYAFPRLDSNFLTALEALDRYWVATTGVLVVFGYAVVRSRSSGWRRMAWFPLGLGAVGLLVALPARPGLSIDALSYLSHGWIAAAPGGNPYLTASAEVGSTPYGQLLFAEGWLPVHGVSPYGALWTHVERLAFAISGGDIGRGLLALKVVVVLAVGVSTLLIWLIARQVRPGWELTAALAFSWSPLVVVEFAMEGHNDAVAIAFTLLGLWAAVTNRAFWAVLGLGLGALTKITPAVFAVPVLILLVRRRAGWSSLVGRLAAGVGVAAALAWLLYRRFWAASATLDGLRAGSVPYPSWSPAGWLGAWFGAPMEGAPDYRPGLVLAAVLIMVVAVVSWQRTTRGLMVACGSIAVAAMALTPAYWPWYAALPVAVLAARSTWVAMAQVLVLTIGSRIAAPYGDLFVIGVVPFERAMQLSTLWGVDVPVALCLLMAVGSVVVRKLRADGSDAHGDGTPTPTITPRRR